MGQAINDAIKLLAGKIKDDTKSDDALRYTQAALNLAHVLAIKGNIAGTWPQKENSMELYEKARAVVDAIEECGASEKLTHAVSLACALAAEIEFMELQEVAIGKGWEVPTDVPKYKHLWTWYWRNSMAYEKDPNMQQPIAPNKKRGQ